MMLSSLVLVFCICWADKIEFDEELETLLFYQILSHHHTMGLLDDLNFMVEFDKKVEGFLNVYNLSALLPSVKYFGSASAFTSSKKYWYLDIIHHFEYKWDQDAYVGDVVLASTPNAVIAATINAFVYDRNEQYAIITVHDRNVDIKKGIWMELNFPNRDYAYYRIYRKMSFKDALSHSERMVDNYRTTIGIVHRSFASGDVDCALAAIQPSIVTHPQEMFVYKDKKTKKIIPGPISEGKAKCFHSFIEFEGDILAASDQYDDDYVYIALPKHVEQLIDEGFSGMYCLSFDGTELMFINVSGRSGIPHIRALKLSKCLKALGRWGFAGYSRQQIKGYKECYSSQECFED